MKDPSIINFFQERKEVWLKKALSPSLTEAETEEKKNECEAMFSLENWLPNAAKRAGQMSISTHPCTFSHPSARKNKNGYVSPIIATKQSVNDGYLRSGNVVVEQDALGNASALDVYKFLTLTMQDGKTVLHHIENDTELAKELLSIKSEAYETLKSGFLAMLETKGETITSAKIKQVYFPVNNDYHLLSVLTASGVVYEVRKRIDDSRISEATNSAREAKKKDEMHNSGFKEWSGITVIGYGGTKPQNISVLNNKNGGKAYLLLSTPPELKTRTIQFPTVNFFTQTFRYTHSKEVFMALHKLFVNHKNNRHVRADRDTYYKTIIDNIIEKAWAIREVAHEQFNSKNSNLNQSQRVWLCDEYEEKRITEDDWLDDIVKQIADYIFNGYEKILGKKANKFSDSGFKHIHKLVDIRKFVSTHRASLR